MASKTDICNMALSHLGFGKTISAIDTDRSAEGIACRRFFDNSRDSILRAARWPFAAKTATLNLVSEDPTDEWEYSYQKPADCIRFSRIVGSIRNKRHDQRIPFRIMHGTAGDEIYCDEEDAVGEYTAKITETWRYPPDFVIALSLYLASMIAPSVANGDRFDIGQRSLQLYQMAVQVAVSAAYNEEQEEQAPTPEMLGVR